MSDQEPPRLRHEFVGMMFAVTIGEVGLQVAALMQAKHFMHYLPFYFHLLLATIVITSSWVGWSLSQAPGARQDVKGVFTWQFVVLLLDVFLVITYFILVRTIEFGKGKEAPRIDSPNTVASLICLMFIFYFVWDLVTKIFLYQKHRDGNWIRNCGLRMAPTIVCLGVALMVRWQVKAADLVHYVSADLALISLALLFRALKDLVSQGFPRDDVAADRYKVSRAIACACLCSCGIVLGTMATKHSGPILLPPRVIDEIRLKPVQEAQSPSERDTERKDAAPPVSSQ
jgi:hypothetical protein